MIKITVTINLVQIQKVIDQNETDPTHVTETTTAGKILIEMVAGVTKTEETVITTEEVEMIAVKEVEIETTTVVDVAMTAVAPLPPNEGIITTANQRCMVFTRGKSPTSWTSVALWSWMVS
jgi:hypothetical protein